jgi:hypothetical protein
MRSSFVVLLVFTALPLVACTGTTAAGPDGGASGTILLQAWGGPAGKVAAQVPLLEPGVGSQATCTVPTVSGACQLTSCTFGGVGSPGPGFGNFGPMSASVGSTTVPITYNGTGYPTVYFPSSVTLATGGTMTFRGGSWAGVPTFDVPSFEVSATIPGLGVITSPVPATEGGAATVDTSHDLTVTWAPISIGQIKLGFDGGSSSLGLPPISIACTFDGDSGSGVVPQELLSSLKAMSGTSPTYGHLSSELDTTTVIDGLTIETQSFQTSATGGHDFQVTLE